MLSALLLFPPLASAAFFPLKARGSTCFGLVEPVKSQDSYDGTTTEFNTEIASGTVLVGSYEATGSREGVKVYVKDVATKEMLWESTSVVGQFKVNAGAPGTQSLELCFDSTVPVSQSVSFSYKTMDPAYADMYDEEGLDEEAFATKHHAEKLSDLVNRLDLRVSDIVDQQQYAITREEVHRDTTESTNERVMWWTIAQVMALLVFSGCQIYYLRSYFEVKQII